MPTVCGLCPVGCNTTATTREGKVKRILSRNHPEVDEGWLCDKGRFAYAHLGARDRITAPLRKAGTAPLRGARLGRRARPGRAAAARRRRVDRDGALRRRVRRGGLRARQAAARGARRERRRAARGRAGLARRLPRAALRAARRAGRSPSSATSRWSSARRSSSSGSRPPAAGARRSPTARREGPSRRARHRRRDRRPVEAANVYYLPRTPNGRGVADAWSAAGDGEPVDAEPKLLVISGDEAATDPASGRSQSTRTP